jgi:hypothetical protein
MRASGLGCIYGHRVPSAQGELDTGHSRKDQGMTKATAEQAGRYVLDGSDEDLRRLIALSEVIAENARRAFRRAGVCEGWMAIDSIH